MALNLSEMIFIPAGEPPHKAGRHQAAAQHRLAMVELAIASNPHFTISLVELDRPGPSYLVDTLRLLRKEWGTDVELSFIIGGDSLKDFPDWHQPAEILAQLTRLVVVHRPGYEDSPINNQQLETRLPGLMQKVCLVPIPQLDISSTDLRRRIAEKRPIKYQVPEAVEEYILTHNLYHTSTESQ
ncbi:putative nicotinate-nucleotide adenylyltransferase [Dictyobacter vulcani]|uniref:Probable nicotinate-nucleotide adenylyltransferase n=1 Tax=Dictyobacter vulcani TaxID=2607529 RepID=A0A5J4KVL3_9CHLR|nr:putative nicotinate-nucleotide adenylyltransferase [Dictyobacter vulcani]